MPISTRKLDYGGIFGFRGGCKNDPWEYVFRGPGGWGGAWGPYIYILVIYIYYLYIIVSITI